jgi:drug/metabolite transporter (DMT)-like permease
MNKEKLKGHVAMFFTATIFGINIPFSKMLMPQWMSAEAMTYSRFLFGAIAFWITSLFVHSEHVTRKDLGLLFIGALLGVVFNQGFFIEGLMRTTSSDASIVTTTTPIMVMIISFIFLKEPITTKKAGGVLLGFVGVLAIIITSDFEQNGRTPSTLGDLLCIASSLSYAFFLVLTRSISKRYQSLTIMKWMFLFATILTFPMGYKDLLAAKIFTQFNHAAWGSFLYMMIGATFITYLLIPVSQKRIRPTTIGMYNYLQPLMASVISIFLGKETFTWVKPIAAILIFMGVYLVTTSKSKEDVEQLALQENRRRR